MILPKDAVYRVDAMYEIVYVFCRNTLLSMKIKSYIEAILL